MFAIVEIAGLQYKVEQDQKLFVNRLSGEKGDKVARNRGILRLHKCRHTFAKSPGEHNVSLLLH